MLPHFCPYCRSDLVGLRTDGLLGFCDHCKRAMLIVGPEALHGETDPFRKTLFEELINQWTALERGAKPFKGKAGGL